MNGRRSNFMCSLLRLLFWFFKYFVVLPLAIFGAHQLQELYPDTVSNVKLFLKIIYKVCCAIVSAFPARSIIEWILDQA